VSAKLFLFQRGSSISVLCMIYRLHDFQDPGASEPSQRPKDPQNIPDVSVGSAAIYYPAFDYLRITLATMVAASHANLVTWPKAGAFSVQVFFALSGWLIGRLLLRSKLSDLPRFYYNRAARIWIPYFVAFGLVVAAALIHDTITPKWFEFLFYKLTFTYNFFGALQIDSYRTLAPLSGSANHFWSISAEEQFYLVAPLLICALAFGRSVWFWVACATLLLAVPLGRFFAAIALGVLAVVIREKIGPWNERRAVCGALGLGAALMFIFLYLDLLPYRIFAPICSVLAVLCLAQPSRSGPSRVGEFLGGVSYPMYLNHWIGAFVTHGILKRVGGIGVTAEGLIAVIFGFIISAVLYQFIDANVRKYRNRFYSRRLGIVIAILGYALVLSGVFVGSMLTTETLADELRFSYQ